jgi:broad specificity phosphatase PhoE
MKNIYYLRHAESTYNKQYRETNIVPHNIIDADVTLAGMDQINKLKDSEILLGIKFDYVIVSPLKRTMNTFLHLGSNIKYNKLIVTDLCREHKINECDFMNGEDIIFETQLELKKRICEFKTLIHSLDGSDILVVSHADFIFYSTCEVINDEEFGNWLDNCEILHYIE